MLIPDIIASKARQKSTEFSEMFRIIMSGNTVKKIPARDIYPRPSSFPGCSLIYLNGLMSKHMEETDTIDYATDMYVNMGTQAHEVLQSWFGETRYKLWGNEWCEKSREVVRKHVIFTRGSKCPKCGTETKYSEIEVQHGRVRGHVDGILIGDDGITITDFKTTSATGIKKASFSKHPLQYAIQVMTYAYLVDKVYGRLFKEKFGTSIKKASVMFVSRDNPRNIREFSWDAKVALDIGKKTVALESGAFYFALKSMREGSIDPAFITKRCRSLKHYKEAIEPLFFDGCPYAEDCIKKKDQKVFKKYLENRMDNLLPW